jgi:Glycosyl transferases group 1
MLTPHMKMGYGVSETIRALAHAMSRLRVTTVVGCLERDQHFDSLDIHRVSADPAQILDLMARIRAGVVVAHGSPFFEVLPQLTPHVRTVAYEYGDPTPEMFSHDAELRRRIADDKKTSVYPNVSAVAAISEFIRHDIGWPAAGIIRLGVDHIVDLGAKPWLPPPDPGAPLRVVTLMRLGEGEAHYKGNEILPLIRGAVLSERPDVRFEVMGRGTETDAARLEQQGFRVHLNATDEQRAQFLRDADVFVSPSQWEGCNLPLVEAQALGTAGLAFDTGAHPEYTPFVFPSVSLLAHQIVAYNDDRAGLLRDHGRVSYRFVRDTMSWDRAALEFKDLISGTNDHAPPRRPPLPRRVRSRARSVRLSIAHRGLGGTAKLAASRLGERRG